MNVILESLQWGSPDISSLLHCSTEVKSSHMSCLGQWHVSRRDMSLTGIVRASVWFVILLSSDIGISDAPDGDCSISPALS